MEKQRNEIDNFFEAKLSEVQNQKLETSKPKKKKSRKGLIISIIALALAGVTAISCIIGFGKKKNKPEDLVPSTSITMNVDDLGKEEDFPKEENKIYGETTGNIKKEDLVEKDGTIWKDKEAADNSNKVGKTETDLQGGKLEIDKDGDVVVKNEKDYVVKDETGKEVDKGANEKGIPEGYSWDSVLNKYVKTEDVGKYVYVDATYYGPDGEVVYKKGDIVLKETLTKIKEQLSTTKPTQQTTTQTEQKKEETTKTQTEQKKEETTTTQSLPVEKVNADGTFTITYEIDGQKTSVTYMDKATYQSWLLDENSDVNYGMYKGIIYPISVIEEMTNQNQKTK